MLTDRELKLLALAIDPAAHDGEADNAATAFFRCLRKRQVSYTEFCESFALTVGAGAPAPIVSKPDFGMCIMPFGKHKGSMLMDIPPSYLIWLKQAIETDVANGQPLDAKRQRLVLEIDGFLAQASGSP